MILFILAIFRMDGLITPWAGLRPTLIWPGYEFWRLLTYPLALNFGGLLIGSIVFAQPGEEMESMFGRTKFGIMLLVVTLLTSILHVLFFWGQSSPILAGPINMSLFVIVGYLYLFPESSVTIFFFSIRTRVLMVLMLLFVFIMSGVSIAAGNSPLVIFSEGVLGLLAGLLWFHVVYQKYPVLLGPIRTIESLFRGAEPQRGEKSSVTVMSRPIRRRERQEEKKASLSDEERLDAILEKIGEKGYQSLTPDEQAFLDEYSSKL